jgi:2-polyprenyl-3-methyl-5-hydroxy-6-metoxy-1,4-benzoquinol methylase
MKAKCKLCGNNLKEYLTDYFDDRHGSPGKFSIFICQSCGLGKTYPELKPDEVQDLYTNFYPRQNLDVESIKLEDYKPISIQLLAKKGLLMNSHLHADPGTDVLDVGSGVGYSLLELKNMGCNPYGLDPDLNAQKVAKKFKIPFHLGFIDDNPFPEKKFDYVCASQVLEHTLDPVTFLKLCSQKLKPEGKLILSFPNFSSLSRNVLGKKYLHWHLPYHQNFFSYKTLFPLAQSADLIIEEIKTYTPNLWTNLQIRHILNTQRYGERDSFWDGASSSDKKTKSTFLTNLLQRGFHILEANNPVNRVVDRLSLGDSFLVKLRLP